MSRTPDPDSPAAAVQPEPGGCIADVGAQLLEETAAHHDHAEPPDTNVDPGDLS
jgi:hypothetical protein